MQITTLHTVFLPAGRFLVCIYAIFFVAAHITRSVVVTWVGTCTAGGDTADDTLAIYLLCGSTPHPRRPLRALRRTFGPREITLSNFVESLTTIHRPCTLMRNIYISLCPLRSPEVHVCREIESAHSILALAIHLQDEALDETYWLHVSCQRVHYASRSMRSRTQFRCRNLQLTRGTSLTTYMDTRSELLSCCGHLARAMSREPLRSTEM